MYAAIPPNKQYRKFSKPRPSLLRRWADKIKEGEPFIPIYRQGGWAIAVPRGNKKYLFLPVNGSN